MLIRKVRYPGAALAALTLGLSAARSQSQETTPENLAACPGSAAEPAQSSPWPVAFCNRTGHDVVIEFHDNECPARDWSHRGDIYQRTLRSGESKTFPLCYAHEPADKKPAPGVPTLRIPGGKGVVTTWTVVGDCGDRSKPLNLDARTFYDRGEYKTGVILLQYPSGASHCLSDASAAAAVTLPNASQPTPSASQTGASGTQPTSAVARAAPAASASVAPPPIIATTTASTNNRGAAAPTLSAAVDAKDSIARTVRLFARDGAAYECNVNLAVTFTDGTSWNDHASFVITNGDVDAPVATRKYLKSVSKVQLTSSKCAHK